MTAPLTLIVEGKPLVFDVPVPVGEVIPAGTAYAYRFDRGDWVWHVAGFDDPVRASSQDKWFTARPPVAPESFADGDVAWVAYRRRAGDHWLEAHEWVDPDGEECFGDKFVTRWIGQGDGFLMHAPRPESLTDVLDDAKLPDELRARIEKAVGAK